MNVKKRHWSERVFWTFAVIASIAMCSYLVYDTWLKWQNTPVIVTFSEKSTGKIKQNHFKKKLI